VITISTQLNSCSQWSVNK